MTDLHKDYQKTGRPTRLHKLSFAAAFELFTFPGTRGIRGSQVRGRKDYIHCKVGEKFRDLHKDTLVYSLLSMKELENMYGWLVR